MVLREVKVYFLLSRNDRSVSHKQPKPVSKADFTAQSDFSSQSVCSQIEMKAVSLSSFFLVLIDRPVFTWKLTCHKVFTVLTRKSD